MSTLAENAEDDTIVIAKPADGMTRRAARPVFLDPTERRRRIVRRVALAACVAVAAYGALLVAALLGGSTSPSFLLPLSGGRPPATNSPGAEAPRGQPSTAPSTGGPGRQPVVPAAVHPAPDAVLAGRPAPPAAPPVPTAAQPSSAPAPAAAPSTAARNSHAPTSPPGWTKRGASSP